MSIARRTNEEWLELVNQQRSSGLTLEGWCGENGVNLHTMADRIGRLRKAGLITEPKPAGGRHCDRRTTTELRKYAALETTQWVEILEPVKPQTLSAPEIRVEVGVYKIIVPPEFSEAVFLRICKALMSL